MRYCSGSAEEAELQDESFDGSLALPRLPVPDGAADLGPYVELVQVAEDAFPPMAQCYVVSEQEGGVTHLGCRHPAEDGPDDAALEAAGPSGDPLAALAAPHAVAHISHAW